MEGAAERGFEGHGRFGHALIFDFKGEASALSRTLEVRCKWAQQDSNLWPQPCEGCALTN